MSTLAKQCTLLFYLLNRRVVALFFIKIKGPLYSAQLLKGLGWKGVCL